MSIYRFTALTIVVLILVSSARGQAGGELAARSADTRTVSVYTGVGFLEFFVIGVQYQVNDKFAVGAKADVVFLGGAGPEAIAPNGGIGGGIKFSYFLDRTGAGNFLWANAMNLEVSYLSPRITKEAGRVYHATGIELTAGRDAIKDKGLGFMWAAGIAFSASTGLPPLIFPALKLGFHVDF